MTGELLEVRGRLGGRKRLLGGGGQSGEALGQMYVQVAFPAESKKRMQELVQNLRDALQSHRTLQRIPGASLIRRRAAR